MLMAQDNSSGHHLNAHVDSDASWAAGENNARQERGILILGSWLAALQKCHMGDGWVVFWMLHQHFTSLCCVRGHMASHLWLATTKEEWYLRICGETKQFCRKHVILSQKSQPVSVLQVLVRIYTCASHSVNLMCFHSWFVSILNSCDNGLFIRYNFTAFYMAIQAGGVTGSSEKTDEVHSSWEMK